MDINEIKNKSISELSHLLSELRAKLDDLSFKVSQSQLKNVREIRIVKKDIAKVMMVLKAENNKKTK